MIILVIVPFCFGIDTSNSGQQLFLLIIKMLGLGFSEEILFRSFLMKAIMNKNVKCAIILPGILFGMVHIFNLLGGADVLVTLLQCIYATSFGLMMAMFFYKTNNIIPCMLFHSLVDIASIFTPDNLSIESQCIFCIAVILPSLFYTVYLYQTKKMLTKDFHSSMES